LRYKFCHFKERLKANGEEDFLSYDIDSSHCRLSICLLAIGTSSSEGGGRKNEIGGCRKGKKPLLDPLFPMPWRDRRSSEGYQGYQFEELS
jgi:hypothetical protein